MRRIGKKPLEFELMAPHERREEEVRRLTRT